MEKDLYKLKEEFQKIKEAGLIKAMRNGPTGVGYTFEYLLNKKEDHESKPDFGSIELKCLIGYSKSDMALFNCVPSCDHGLAVKYIFEKYSYYRYDNTSDYRLFSRKVFANTFYEHKNISFKLKVDYDLQLVIMKSYHSGVFLEDVCYWTFSTLENKLETKLKKLAICYAYPYPKNGELFYKYLKMDIMLFTNFYNFLKLIESEEVYVSFYMREGVNKLGDYKIEDHGVAFKIKRSSIGKLFCKI